jgi:hypothetical protein
MMALASSASNRRTSIMFTTIKGRIPYVSDVRHDWDILHTIGIKIHKYPRLFDKDGVVTIKLTRKYPPRVIWVTATRQGGMHMGYHLWSQHVK